MSMDIIKPRTQSSYSPLFVQLNRSLAAMDSSYQILTLRSPQYLSLDDLPLDQRIVFNLDMLQKYLHPQMTLIRRENKS